MANITRIKAGAPSKPKDKPKDKSKAKKQLEETTPRNTDEVDKKVKIAKKSLDRKLEKEKRRAENPKKQTFVLFRPFVVLGRYLRDSWRELRQVRWPNRKLTWQMVLAVFVYTLIFVAFLVALDLLFDWLFSIILK
ncbi:preprotein translocase subunit SecE [Candidatus Saccharibacteria bacterium]|nr:preprotein translocase subunit SecE [Candidatus Saccharibacteria bacterium]